MSDTSTIAFIFYVGFICGAALLTIVAIWMPTGLCAKEQDYATNPHPRRPLE
jgi:hypothetical protein